MTSGRQPTLVVAQDLLRRSVVQDRQRRTSTTDCSEFIAQRDCAETFGLACQSLTQCDHNRFGQRLPRPCGEFPGEPISLGIFDA